MQWNGFVEWNEEVVVVAAAELTSDTLRWFAFRFLCRTNGLSQDKQLSYTYCVCSVNVDASPRIYNMCALQPYDRSILSSTTDNRQSVPDSEQLRRWKLSLVTLLLLLRQWWAARVAAAECTVNVSHYTIAYNTIGVVGRPMHAGFASEAASDEGFFGESIFSSEFLSFVLQRW